MTDEDKKRQAAVLAEIAALPQAPQSKTGISATRTVPLTSFSKIFGCRCSARTPSSERFGRQLEYRDRGWR
jgi:hypothetical protein